MSKVIKGDVFELITPKGKLFIQNIDQKPKEPNLVRILQRFHIEESLEVNKLVEEPEQFSIFFALRFALKKGIVRKVGNFNIPNSYNIPTEMRTPVVDKNGKLKHWHIVDVETLVRKRVDKLSDTQKKLSPHEIWNDTLLIERLVSGWTLENWKED
ncbi:hypothetical protein KHQ81_11835 [Mycoplasmatota bacterium]|nr:hypothetical protein KHQ81_11835 [Mycoplasmatota bacterium]